MRVGFRPAEVPRPVNERVLARYREGAHVAEIREREITMVAAFEGRVYVDGSMTESRIYHRERAAEFWIELLARKGCFEDGWIEVTETSPY